MLSAYKFILNRIIIINTVVCLYISNFDVLYISATGVIITNVVGIYNFT